MNKIILLLLFCFSLFAAEQNKASTLEMIEVNKDKINQIDRELNSGDIWIKKYNDYLTYKRLLVEQEDAKDRLYVLKKQNASASEIKNAQKRLETIKNQLALIDQYKRSSLGDLTLIGDIGDKPEVTNPISVIYALTFIQHSVDQIGTYKQRLASLDKTIDLLENKKKLLVEQKNLDDANKTAISEKLDQINAMLKDFDNEREDFDATISIYEKKNQDIVKTLQAEIKTELTKLGIIVFTISLIIALSIVSKKFAQRYWAEHHQERLYVAAKVVNFSAVVLIAITLLIAYSSNVGYMVTILGFASAGIAISLKDWFLSIFGWMTILTTGQIKVGNRVKIIGKDGEVAGDILDVSLMRITLYEDVSLLGYTKDQRAGRVIFIPNSYIFTHIIISYNHSTLQTIWDSVYVTLSYNSDLEKAVEIGKEIALKHSKHMITLADRQMNKLRSSYNVPKYGTNPRVFTFIERGCIVLNVWYLSNYFTPMVTKSLVTRELVKALREAEDIEIVYAPHTVVVQGQQTLQSM